MTITGEGEHAIAAVDGIAEGERDAGEAIEYGGEAKVRCRCLSDKREGRVICGNVEGLGVGYALPARCERLDKDGV